MRNTHKMNKQVIINLNSENKILRTNITSLPGDTIMQCEFKLNQDWGWTKLPAFPYLIINIIIMVICDWLTDWLTIFN